MSCDMTKPTKCMQSVKTQIRLCINPNEALLKSFVEYKGDTGRMSKDSRVFFL